MASQREQVLRLGVIRGGKIVEERVLAPRQPVSIGSSPGNTIAVPQSDLPSACSVLSFEGEGYVLHFAQGMDGQLHGPQGITDLAALVSQGIARANGTTWSVPVGAFRGGKIAIGEVMLLWRFVPPPPDGSSPALARELKGAHFKSMDRLFVTVLAVSLFLHSGAYLALASTDLPKEMTLEEIPDRYARILIPERLPHAARKAEERKPDVAGERKPDRKEPEKKQETVEQVAERKAARAAAVARAVQSKGILKVLGALGPGAASGATADVFGSGTGVGDVASALSGTGGLAVATDPGATGGRKGGREAGAASIGSLTTTGGGKVGLGTKTEVRVAGSVAAQEAEVDSSDVDQEKLGAFVRARMGLIKACYENALKRNPSMKGRISIRFTILETGALADVSAPQNSLGAPEVAACIINTMRSWHTQFHPSGPVTVEYPFVFSPVN